MKKEAYLGHFSLVIFGGDGDLAMKKIFPAPETQRSKNKNISWVCLYSVI